MKNITRNTFIWRSAATLALLAVFAMPSSPGVALDIEPAISAPATNSALTPSATNIVPAATEAAQPRARKHRGGPARDLVEFGRSVELSAGKTADDMVVIGGSATALGRVLGDLVAIWGNVTVGDEVRGDTVAVLGNVKLETNAVVHGDTVAVLGNVKLEPNAKAHGDVVAVGGAVERAEGAQIDGAVVGFPGFSWVGDWLEQCAFKLRPLAPQLGWLWAINGALLLIYLLIALAFPRPVQACVDEIARRPATTVLLGLLTRILLPLVFLILVVTGIGIFVVPFLLVAVIAAAMVGKVALLQYLGQQIGRQLNLVVLQRPLPAFLLGWVLITVLYLVPVLGLVVFTLTGMWALGAAVMALFSGRRREMNGKPAVPPPVGGVPPAFGTASAMAAAAPGATSHAPPVNSGVAPSGTPEPPPAPETQAASPPPPQTAAAGAAAPPMAGTEVLSHPKAGFWERMGAGFLDVVLVGILGAVVGGAPLGFLVALAYFSGMWAWKGTTVGGIVLKLQVVRADGRPVTFVVALVRALAAAFSMVMLFLGFLWIAWDPDKQGWHDKIAGTIVVRLPRSPSLVCL